MHPVCYGTTHTIFPSLEHDTGQSPPPHPPNQGHESWPIQIF